MGICLCLYEGGDDDISVCVCVCEGADGGVNLCVKVVTLTSIRVCEDGDVNSCVDGGWHQRGV